MLNDLEFASPAELEVYLYYGYVMSKAHELEQALALLAARFDVSSQPDPSAAWDSTLDGRDRMTMGKLLSDRRMKAHLPRGLWPRLDAAARRRNVLAHDFFRYTREFDAWEPGPTELLAALTADARVFECLGTEVADLIFLPIGK